MLIYNITYKDSLGSVKDFQVSIEESNDLNVECSDLINEILINKDRLDISSIIYVCYVDEEEEEEN